MARGNPNPNLKGNSELAKTMGAKGGKASGEARRRRADLRKAANAILTGKKVKVNGEEISAEEAMVLAMLKKAVEGDVGAYKALLVTLGINGTSELDEKEQRARIKKMEAEASLMRKKAEGNDTAESVKVYIVDDIPAPGQTEAG